MLSLTTTLSNEAINAQLKKLYEEELPGESQPPDFEIDDQVALPPPNHYINHDFKVLIKNDKAESEAELQGIDGHIECPTVTFHPTKRGVAIVTLTFQRDKAVADPERQDSYLQHFLVEKDPKSIHRLIINDWSISWECNLAAKDINNVVGDLINPAESRDHQVQLHPDTINRLRSVDSNTFTASSIFCMIQAAQMSNSFEIKQPAGYRWPTELNDAHTQSLATQAQALIVDHFQKMHRSAEGHLPTAHNPFVLGYSLRGNVPSIRDLNASANTEKTPAYFIPRRVDCTTTPSSGNEYTDGTLNFCISTYRQDESTYAPPIDIDTVTFPETFFQKLSVRGGIKKTASGETKGGHDGIMAFSKNIFSNMFLDSLGKRFFADPTYVGNEFATAAEGPTNNEVNRNESKIERGLGNMLHLGYDGTVMPQIHCGAPDVNRKFNGYCCVMIEYWSDFLWYDQAQRNQTDLQRKLYVDFQIQNGLELQMWSENNISPPPPQGFFGYVLGGLQNAIVGPTIPIILREQTNANYRLHYKVGYVLSPGQGGVWSMAKDDSRTTIQNVNFQPNVIDRTDQPIGNDWKNFGSDGYEMYVQKFHLSKTKDFPTWFGDFGQKWFQEQKGAHESVEETLMDSIKNVVIMPAGNVLTFHGLDCDVQGNVYSTVDYMSSSVDVI